MQTPNKKASSLILKIALASTCLLTLFFVWVALPTPSYAGACIDASCTTPTPTPTPTSSPPAKCTTSSPKAADACLKANPIIKDINSLINFLSIGVGVVVVIMIIVGGIRYTTADNPQAVSAAKQHITNALIALVAFLLTFAFLQWLVPGGIFG